MPESFRIDVAESVLGDLRQRLTHARLPRPISGGGWRYGADPGFMRALCDYWRDDYDWRRHEAVLNGWPQGKARIGGLGIHFLHARSSNPEALPLMVTHGWPGSVYEFYKIIEPLREPQNFGGDAADAFHVVCPSLPGFGWSDAPREPGWDVRNIAAALTALMHSLGYARYGVQGGDLGSLVSSYAGILDPDGVCGAHLNLVFSSGTDDVEDAREHGVVAGPVAFVPDYIDSMCCAQTLGRAPDSFGYALNDSPAGLAALIVHAFQQWCDHDGDLQAAVDVDELLTNIMIYWVTESMPSSLRLFWEMLASGRFGPPETRVEVPTGAAQFRDICMPRREWAERHYNIVHWNEFQSGGHFAALEQPEALVADIREFFRPLR